MGDYGRFTEINFSVLLRLEEQGRLRRSLTAAPVASRSWMTREGVINHNSHNSFDVTRNIRTTKCHLCFPLFECWRQILCGGLSRCSVVVIHSIEIVIFSEGVTKDVSAHSKHLQRCTWLIHLRNETTEDKRRDLWHHRWFCYLFIINPLNEKTTSTLFCGVQN